MSLTLALPVSIWCRAHFLPAIIKRAICIEYTCHDECIVRHTYLYAVCRPVTFLGTLWLTLKRKQI